MAKHSVPLTVILEHRNNSLGLVRLVLACLVIVSHSWTIGGFGFEPLTITSNGISLGLFSVTGFFCLSGMLVSISAERSTAGTFLLRRAGRILPGYWAALLVSGMVFGIAIAAIRGLDIRNALLSPANGSVRTYIVNNFPLSASQYNLGRVLDGMPYPNGINGSLWSLPYEFACYLVILLVVKWAISSARQSQVLLIVGALSLALAILANKQGPIFVGIPFPLLGTLDSRLFFNLWLAFMAGALTSHFREQIPLRGTWVCAASTLVMLSIPLDMFWPWGALLFPYALIGLAYFLPNKFRNIGSINDFSYGMYLYGFPVGQLLVAMFPDPLNSGLLLAIATIVMTSPVAVASWFFVERHFVVSRPTTSGQEQWFRCE